MPSFACGRRRIRVLLAASLLPIVAGAQSPRLVAPPDGFVTRGVPPGLKITGLSDGDSVTLVAWRRVIRSTVGGRADTLVVRSRARFVGARDGQVLVDETAPLGGTWSRADPAAFLWAMERADTMLALPLGRVLLRLDWHGRTTDSVVVTVRNALPALERRWVEGGGFAAAFVRPAGPGPFPALLLLHGSEGGDSASARTLAESFANHGFAALALTYFAWGGRIRGVPAALVNVPLEMLDAARGWLGAQPGVDTTRTGIWGGSKGAELALVAATRRSWPAAVVGCVPSDVVWMGFGRAPQPGETLSSWSDSGRALSYVPYDRYEDVLAGRATARAVHDRSRLLFPDSARAAAIQIGRARARLLLIGSDRDRVWASGDMTRALAAQLAATNRASQVTVLIHPAAGLGVCGTGATPWPLLDTMTGADSPADARATAQAAAESWRATIRFLTEALASPHPR